MAEQPDTRNRIQDAAAMLFRRDGYPGTGLKRIAAASGAPFGSIYHFFPGGKQQLAEHTIRNSGPEYMRMVLAVLDGVDDPVDAVLHSFDVAAERLVATSYADACPIATIALEVAGTDEVLREATAEVFEDWVHAGTEWFGRWVTDPQAARSLAYSMIMILEGAFVLSRATRDPEPLRVAGRSMAALTSAALDRPGTSRDR